MMKKGVGAGGNSIWLERGNDRQWIGLGLR